MKQPAILAVAALALTFGTGHAALAAGGHGHHGHHGHHGRHHVGHHHHSGIHFSFGVGHHYGHHAYSYPYRSYAYSYPSYRHYSYSYPTYSSYRYRVRYPSCSTNSYRVVGPAAPIQQTIERKSLPEPDVDAGKPKVDPPPEPVATPIEFNDSAARENDGIRSRLHLVGLRATNPVSHQSSSERVAKERATAQAGPSPEFHLAVPTVRPLVSDHDAPWIVE